MTPRWLHQAWAWIAGYFWNPCPRCHEPFGGHEHQSYLNTISDEAGNWIVCPLCDKEMERRATYGHRNGYRIRIVRATP